MTSTISDLRRKLEALEDESSDLNMTHRCEVQALKEIIKAMSIECDALRQEKVLLQKENGRLTEAIVAAEEI